MDFEHWQLRWDLQQESYMPDREARFAAMLDVLEAALPAGVTHGGDAHGSEALESGTPAGGALSRGAPRVLDLAGGTGSITRRVLARFPQATSVVVDVDPALLAIASGTFEGDRRVRVIVADLSSRAWVDAVEDSGPFDAVLTATALHWFEAERVSQLYREVHELLVPGGLMANVDHMPDAGLAPLEDRFGELAERRAEEYRTEHATTDWEGWWSELAAVPEMAPLVEARAELFGARAGHSHTQSEAPSHWHEAALRAAGFSSVGIAWRHLGDALVVALR